MANRPQSSATQSDPWLLDTFGWFDHDYKHPRYIKILKERKYKLFGNWPYLFNGTEGSPLEAKIKILLLGGSTTSIVNNSTWSDYLFDLLTASCESVAIFNGGCGLYNSFNEYMKLSRDILFMAPTHVLSLSGVNDTNASAAISNGFSGMLIEPLVAGNVYTRLNTDFPCLERVVRWLDESKNMNSICEAHDTKFFRFFQPILCSSSNPYSELSDELKGLVHWMGDLLGDREEYIKAVQIFYNSLEKACFPNYILDITDSVPSENRLWHDARHPTDEGYQLIANAIYEHVFGNES